MLSREGAIKKHREMWNWIADRIKESESVQDIDFLKQEYTRQHGEYVTYNCYLCHYCMDKVSDDERHERCKCCPLDWESSGDEDGFYQCLENGNFKGYYGIVRNRNTGNRIYQYELCKKIANLKEREIEGEENGISKEM